MLGTFLDKITGFFDQRFMLSYVMPTFVFLGLFIGFIQVWFGLLTTLHSWMSLAILEQILIGVIVLLAVIVVAYMLQMLTAPIVRFYEGYWPEWKLTELAIAHQRKNWMRNARNDRRKDLTNQLEKLIESQETSIDNDQIDSIQEQIAKEVKHATAACYYRYPRNPERLKPTKLGNILIAVEEYPHQIYQLDATIWWPRLAVLLPQDFRVQVDMSLSPMLAAINLSSLFTLLAFISLISILFNHQWLLYGLIFIIGLLLARVLYYAVISQATVYGKLVRVAFDLYRHEILKQMHIPLPDNLYEERTVWNLLTNWHYYYVAPWHARSDFDVTPPENPLYYDNNSTSATRTQLQEVSFTIKDLPYSLPKNGKAKKEAR
jgi:hypothetical protein